MDVPHVIMGLLGGLAIFLFGLNQMATALKAVAGAGMRDLIARLTTNRVRGAFTGAFVTAVIQSSSVTTVLLVGFISAGLMTLEQSIGVIMGANIGSTLTAQLIAFKVTSWALGMVALGYLLQFVVKGEHGRLYGSALFGLGLLFLGMKLMAEATEPLRHYEPFIELMVRMGNPLLGIIMGTLFTGLVQSSAATTGIVIVLAGQGFVTLEAGIALALGANIGTCVTALLASIGKSREARRAAAAHILFNVAGVLVWVGLIGVLADFVKLLAPTDVARQIANAHTAFNVANTFLFIGFTKPMAGVVRFLVRDRKKPEDEALRPRYLDEALLQTPELALRGARLEIVRLGERTQLLLDGSLRTILRGTEGQTRRTAEECETLDGLYSATLGFLGRLSRAGVTEDQGRRTAALVAVLNHVQNVALTVETNLLALAHDRLERDILVSGETEGMVQPLHRQVLEALEGALRAVAYDDPEMAASVVAMKDTVNDLSARAKAHLLRRLTADAPNRQWTFRVESDLVENLKRVYYFAKRIAKAVQGEFEAGSPANGAI